MQVTRRTEVARIDRDYLYERGNNDFPSRADGTISWSVAEVFKFTTADGDWLKQFKIDAPNNRTRFRLLDDDEEVYYGGWLYNDDECNVQDIILKWGAHDAGCTIIEVKVGGQWQREIG